MKFDYCKCALEFGDVLPVDGMLITRFNSVDFKKVVNVAVKDIHDNGLWSDTKKSNYFWVKRSISGLMIEKGYVPIIDLERSDDTMLENHTIKCFLSDYLYNRKIKDPFCRRLSTVNSANG